jgi:hypothetical protein
VTLHGDRRHAEEYGSSAVKNMAAVQSSFLGLKNKDGGRNVSTFFRQL